MVFRTLISIIITLLIYSLNANEIEKSVCNNEKSCEKLIKFLENEINHLERKGIDNLSSKEFTKLDNLQNRMLIAIKKKKSYLTKNRILIRYIQRDPKNIDFIRKVIDAGADVNTIHENRISALMLASYYGHIDIVKVLIENNADVNMIVEGSKYTALNYAIEQNHNDVVKLLLLKNAKMGYKLPYEKECDFNRNRTHESSEELVCTSKVTLKKLRIIIRQNEEIIKKLNSVDSLLK